MTNDRTDSTTVFSGLLDLASASATAGANVARFVSVTKRPEGGTFALDLTEEGTRLHERYEQAFRMAEEYGLSDQSVQQAMKELADAWPSHPGVVETVVNDAVERDEAVAAVTACDAAIGAWMTTLRAAGGRWHGVSVRFARAISRR